MAGLNEGVNDNCKVLVAYFSRTGEQYSVGNITEGNTAIIAKMIANKTNGDLFEIKVAKDNYPKGYAELTEYAKKELQANARPEIIGGVNDFNKYDTVFVGYPIWWGDKPMPVYTFLDSYDFNGKTIIPFCTHEGSGYCGEQGMARTGAKVIKGLAIYGHTAQNDRLQADKQLTEWLKGLGF
ncbi:flavodoxin [bacterium]|nr:flavodoxin [bacterium]